MDYFVSNLSVAGMICSLIIAVAFPIVLLIIGMKKYKGKFTSFLIGCGVFIVAALIIESIFHNIIFAVTGNIIRENIWLYAVYGGLCAAFFEETARYLAMKLFMKKSLTKENALMYGIGHGGIESILLLGFAQISNISLALMINSGQLSTITQSLNSATTEIFMAQVTQLTSTEPMMFFLGGVERLGAVVLQICLSLIIYKGVKNKSFKYYLIAFAIHFGVDAGLVILSNFMPLLLVEIVFLAFIALLAILVFKDFNKEKSIINI